MYKFEIFGFLDNFARLKIKFNRYFSGWALTLISPKMVGAAANMQTIGQMIGATSWNIYFSFVDGKMSYPHYLRIWCIVYLVSTLIIIFIVKEKPNPKLKNSVKNVARSYKNLFRLFSLSSISKGLR